MLDENSYLGTGSCGRWIYIYIYVMYDHYIQKQEHNE
jgi:hypothetical protein